MRCEGLTEEQTGNCPLLLPVTPCNSLLLCPRHSHPLYSHLQPHLLETAPKVKLEEAELDTKDHLAAMQMEIDSGSGTDVPETKLEEFNVKVEKEEPDSSEDPQKQTESSAGTDGETSKIKIKEEQAHSDYQKSVQSLVGPLVDGDTALKIKSKNKGSDTKDHSAAKKSVKDSGKGTKKKRQKGSQGIKMPNKLILDTERLIIEIRKRPSLFNPSNTDFADKQKRREAWEEICVEIIKDWATSSSKIQVKYLNEIRKRWMTLRDYFQKELEAPTKKNRNGSRSSRKSTFIYFSDLQFLKPIIEDSETSVQVDEEMYDEPIEETGAMNSLSPTEDGNTEPLRDPVPLNPQSPETENSDGETAGDTASLNPPSPANEDSVRERVRYRANHNQPSPASEDSVREQLRYRANRNHLSPASEDSVRERVRYRANRNQSSPASEDSVKEWMRYRANHNQPSPASEDSVREQLRYRANHNHLSPEREDVIYRPRASEPQPIATGKLSKKRKHIHEDDDDDDDDGIPELPKPISYFRDTLVDDERDEDRLFLLSLLKTLKRFSASQKLEIKLKMRQTVARAAKEGSPQPSHAPYPQQQQPYIPSQYSHSYTQQCYMPNSAASPPSDMSHRMHSPYPHNYSGPSYENAHRQSPPLQSYR
ncbi:uncharacterized protein LOC108719523 isoform X3 [Xenopus laevis]|uniref:Uncharacterized protein LOC108719523 isoform X3 n=1 Tax=Xenopus laevis TaxID=8355 RepID=A0A8J1KZV4_XENLA|nr:uncharacterized protein LOC108719523 isoform X3 [Xenopus laevis]